MDKSELLREYVNLLEKNPFDLTLEEKRTMDKVESDSELISLANQIKNLSFYNSRMEIVENYAKQFTVEMDSIKEACEKKYGINIKDIEHMRLNNGVEILSFYDEKLNRNRIIDYSYAKSLVEEFTNIQNNNQLFQGNDYEKNANEIAKNEANNNLNREFNMIYIDDFKNNYQEYLKRIPNLDGEKATALKKLVSESTAKNLKYINVENMIALDSEGKIIESVIDEKTKESRLETPMEFNSNVEKVSNDDKIEEISNMTGEDGIPDTSSVDTDNNQINNEPSDFEAEEVIVSEEELDLDKEMKTCNIKGNKQEIIGNIKAYASNMSKLDSDYSNKIINEQEYNFYELMCNKYLKQLQKKKTLTKKLAYDTKNNTGYISVLIISVVTLVVAIVTVLYILSK